MSRAGLKRNEMGDRVLWSIRLMRISSGETVESSEFSRPSVPSINRSYKFRHVYLISPLAIYRISYPS